MNWANSGMVAKQATHALFMKSRIEGMSWLHPAAAA